MSDNITEIILPLWVDPTHIESFVHHAAAELEVEDDKRWQLKDYVILDSSRKNKNVVHSVIFAYKIHENQVLFNKYFPRVDIGKFSNMDQRIKETYSSKSICKDPIMPSSVTTLLKKVVIYFSLNGTYDLSYTFNKIKISERFPYANYKVFQKVNDTFQAVSIIDEICSPDPNKIFVIDNTHEGLKPQRFVTFYTDNGSLITRPYIEETSQLNNKSMTQIIDCASAEVNREASANVNQDIMNWKSYFNSIREPIEISRSQTRTDDGKITLENGIYQLHRKLVSDSMGSARERKEFLTSLLGREAVYQRHSSGKTHLEMIYLDTNVNISIFLDILQDYMAELRNKNILEERDVLEADERSKFVHEGKNIESEGQTGAFTLRFANGSISVNLRPGTKKSFSLPYLKATVKAATSTKALYMMSVFGCVLKKYYEDAETYAELYASVLGTKDQPFDVDINLEKKVSCSDIEATTKRDYAALTDKDARKMCKANGCGPPGPDGKCTENSEMEKWRAEGTNYKRTVQAGSGGRRRTPLVVSGQRLKDILRDHELPPGSYAQYPRDEDKYLLCPDIGSDNPASDYRYISMTKVPGNCDGALVPACGNTDNKEKLSEGWNLYGSKLNQKNLRTKTYYQYDFLFLKEGQTFQDLVEGMGQMGIALIGYHLVYNAEESKFKWQLYESSCGISKKKKKKKKDTRFLQINPVKISNEVRGAFYICTSKRKKTKNDRQLFSLKVYIGLDSMDNKDVESDITKKIKEYCENAAGEVRVSQRSKDQLKTNSELASSKAALPGILGKLPTNLTALLRFLSIKHSDDELTEWRRIGVGDNAKVSVINCLLLAVTGDVSRYKTSYAARESLRRKVREYGIEKCMGLIAVSAGIKSPEDLDQYIKSGNLNIREIHPLLESLWKMNIIVTGRYWTESNKGQFKLPFHKNFYHPSGRGGTTKMYKRTIVIYEHCGRPDSCCEYVCELVRFKKAGKSTYTLPEDFGRELRTIWLNSSKSFAVQDRTRDASAFASPRPISLKIEDWSEWKVLLGDGDLIGFQKDGVDFYPLLRFMTPLPLELGASSTVQTKEDIIQVINDCDGTVIKETQHSVKCTIKEVELEAPIRSENSMIKLRINKRIGSSLFGYAMFKHSENLDTPLENLFVKIEDEDPSEKIYTSLLPPPEEAMMGDKIKIFAQFGDFDKIVAKLGRNIQIYQEKYPKDVEKWKTRKVIPGFYTDVIDFTQSAGTVITKWKGLKRLFNGALYTFPLFNTESTYYLKSNRLTKGKVCLARTFNLRDFNFVSLKYWLESVNANEVLDFMSLVIDKFANKAKYLGEFRGPEPMNLAVDLRVRGTEHKREFQIPVVDRYVEPNACLTGLNFVKYPSNGRMVAFLYTDYSELVCEEDSSDSSGSGSDSGSDDDDSSGSESGGDDDPESGEDPLSSSGSDE